MKPDQHPDSKDSPSKSMKFKVSRTDLAAIVPLRERFLQENNFQIRYNACHERGWTDSYLVEQGGKHVGYGAVNGQEIKDRDTIFEFYLLPSYRKYARDIFSDLIASSGATLVECQSNELLLTGMLFEFTEDVSAGVVLFGDHRMTDLQVPDTIFRPWRDGDDMFDYRGKPGGEYVLEATGEVVAVGGFLLHYNKPFADLHMTVKEGFRRQGYGSFILQELKKRCYLAGRVPAARCNVENRASRATLAKAGLKECGLMLKGRLKQ